MKLRRVTFTGADESVHPAVLSTLSVEFPFVEWGILFGAHTGPRFPAGPWLAMLSREALQTDMHLSAHLCGPYVRKAMRGVMALPSALFSHFERVQLNFHAISHKADADKVLAMIRKAPTPEWIFQLDRINDGLFVELCPQTQYRQIVPLFDRSGGKGIVPRQWPVPYPRVRWSGYAGGLGPDNVLAELERISLVVGEGAIWIDMERNVRSEDDTVFDLDKVRAVCTAVKPFVETT